MEFATMDIFQHSPFGDMLNSLKSLSLSGDSWPNYVRLEWEASDEGIRCPPTTHFIATVDDVTDKLDFDSDNTDGMDVGAGDDSEPRGAGLPPRHTVYTWWIRLRRTTAINRRIKPRTKAKTTAQTPLQVQQQ